MFKKENLNQLQATPRNISTGVALRSFFGQPGAIIGWIFLIMGVVFSFVFLQYFNFNNFRFLIASHQQTTGQVQEIKATGVTMGGSKTTPGQMLYELDYLYSIPADQKVPGKDFVLGKKYQVGDQLKVEYLTGNSQVSRISGNTNANQWLVLIVLLFPIIGLIFVIAEFIKAKNYWKLLKYGKFTMAELISSVETGTRLKSGSRISYQFKLTFGFKLENGELHQAAIKTFNVLPVQDDKLEGLLYDPGNPDKIMLLDEFPGNLQVDMSGKITLA